MVATIPPNYLGITCNAVGKCRYRQPLLPALCPKGLKLGAGPLPHHYEGRTYKKAGLKTAASFLRTLRIGVKPGVGFRGEMFSDANQYLG